MSLSQHVEALLLTAVRKPPAAQAYNAALGKAIEVLAGNIERRNGANWRDNPFTAQALLHAMDALLLRFAAALSEEAPPVPDIVATTATRWPEDLGNRYRTPAGLGHLLAMSMIAEVEDFASGRHDEWTTPRGIADTTMVPDDFINLLARDLNAKGKKS